MTNEPINEEVTPEVEEVSTPEEAVQASENEAMQEADEKAQMEEAEAAELNKRIAAVTGAYFRTMAEISDEEIYELAFTPAGQESPRLLELVNHAFTNMMSTGGDIPRGHFDSYARVVESFNKTFTFNIECKLDANRDAVLAMATGKTKEPERISHQDIADAAEPKA